jgi:2-polyprenyl-6-hydroxyphenyl methylase / 3-demethylubiquinone-9 3-methyltransferase
MEATFSKETKVNNDYYHHLGEDWLTANDDPIALLRAESKIKNPWVLKTISAQLGSGQKDVLDIGCGGGFLSNAMALEGHQVNGIDMSSESLAVAKKSDVTGTANYQSANAYELPFKDESFDVVCAMDFLEHVEDPAKVILEASRVLKPGGVFFFHTFSKNILAYLVIIKLVEWFLPKTPKHLHILRLFISPKALVKMNTLANLETKHMMGIRPEFGKLAFWKSLLKREIDTRFSFTFTSSTMLSYIGFARKTDKDL